MGMAFVNYDSNVESSILQVFFLIFINKKHDFFLDLFTTFF